MLNLNLSLHKLVTLNILYLVFYCGIIFIYVNTDHCIVLCVPSIYIYIYIHTSYINLINHSSV